MPVIDLRNLLEVPQEAPANPAFQRTRQLAQMPQTPYQSAYAFEKAAPMVRANQGLAYLGAIQNHQNQISQEAQNIRLQQEAQAAAENATQGLSGVSPEHPQYLQQRQQILQQNPNALLNPQFRNALNVYDQGYTQISHQRQLQANQMAAQQKQAQSLGLRAIEYGAHPDVVAEHVANGDIGSLAQVAGEARRSSMGQGKTATKSPELSALKDNFDLLADERNQFIKDGAEVPSDIEKEYQDTKKLLVGARKAIYQPQSSAATVESNAAPVPAPAVSAPPVAKPAAVEETELANVPYSQIGKVAAQKKAENEEIHRVNQAWTQAKSDLENSLKSVIPDAPFEGTKVNQLERFAKAVVDNEIIPDPEFENAMDSGSFTTGIPVWKPVLDQLNLKGEAFKNPDSAILSKTSVPYEDLLKAWAQDYLNRKGKLIPTKESPTGAILTPEQEVAFKKLEAAVKGK
jgi:hypothetical protein